MISTALEDQDVIALVTDNGNTCAGMFFIRGGKLIGQEHFMLENASSDELAQGISEFITQYYDTAPYVPREILLSEEIDEVDIVESWLRQKRGSKVEIASPRRGERKRLVEMARKNAELVLKQLKLKMSTDEARVREELDTLRAAIGIDALPRRIEAYDISNIQGYHTVASLVVFENGQPKKDHYRKFKIKRPEGQPDDYASMREVISRRLTGALRRSRGFEEPPDLMLIDGGKGQLSAALEAIAASDEEVAAIGLAKRNEEIFRPGLPDPVLLPRNSKALHLIQRIRDESHRFAVTYHRTLRDRTMRLSVLNEVPGIGPTRRKALIKHFGTVEKIKSASVEDLPPRPRWASPPPRRCTRFSGSEKVNGVGRVNRDLGFTERGDVHAHADALAYRYRRRAGRGISGKDSAPPTKVAGYMERCHFRSGPCLGQWGAGDAAAVSLGPADVPDSGFVRIRYQRHRVLDGGLAHRRPDELFERAFRLGCGDDHILALERDLEKK